MGLYPFCEVKIGMNKKLGRVLYSHVWIYFVVMAGFAAASFAMDQYLLAGIEAAATVAAVVIYILHKRSRNWEIQQFLAKLTDAQNGVKGAENPFPTAVIRLPGGQILHGNDAFCVAAEYTEGLSEKTIGEVINGFPVDWLTAGKKEYPYDITVRGRRYRVFGTAVRADDPASTPMGVLRFVDLTELEYLDLINALFCEVNPIPVKEAMNQMGMGVGGYRLPLCEISEGGRETVRRALEVLR